MGRVYGGGNWYDNVAFRGKRAMVSITTEGPESLYRADGLNGDITHILFFINHGMRRFTGFDGLPPFIAWSPAHLNDDIRHDYLNAYGRRILALWETDPIPYPPLSAYDPETFRLK